MRNEIQSARACGRALKFISRKENLIIYLIFAIYFNNKADAMFQGSILHARKGRGQIALEFLIVYTVVLLIFLVLFALIASQRAATLYQQQYSEVQLISEDIAGHINQALSSGSGYSTVSLLPTSSSLIPYQLFISSSGVVEVRLNSGQEAVSYSNARNLQINGTLNESGNGVELYEVPTYTGSIRITNFRNTIYIDEQPVTTSYLAGALYVKQKGNQEAATFNGISSYINVSNSQTNYAVTISAWVYFRGSPSLNEQDIFTIWCKSPGPGIRLSAFNKTSTAIVTSSGDLSWPVPADSVPANSWHMVVGEYDPSTGNMSLYLDGAKVNSKSGTTNTHSINVCPYGIGNLDTGSSNSDFFNGSIANVQLYNTTLTKTQVQQLYNEGISGAPVLPENITGWWPLNGNLKDYSGYGDAGFGYNLNYTNVAQEVAHVSTTSGIGEYGAMIGFITSAGYLTSSNGSISDNNLTVDAFNGNISTTADLMTWLPLDLGYGNIVYNLGIEDNTGTLLSPRWSGLPNTTSLQAAAFPGDTNNVQDSNVYDGFVTINTTNRLLDVARNDTFTVTAWVYYKGGTPSHMQGIFGDWNYTGYPGFQVVGWGGAGPLIVNASSDVVPWPAGVSSIPKDRWVMVTAQYNGFTGQANVYVNNTLFSSATLPEGLYLTQVIPYYIGDDAWQPGGYDSFNGSIANVQLYAAYLTPAQVSSIYYRGIDSAPLQSAGLVGWWPLDGNANDFSAGGADGKVNYNVTFKNVVFNFTSNDTVKVPYLNAYSFIYGIGIGPWLGTNHDFTASAWFYGTGGGPVVGLSGSATPSGGYAALLSMNSSGYISGSVPGIGSVSYKGNMDHWYLATVTYDAAAGVMYFYVDGQLVGYKTGVYAPGSSANYFTTYVSGAEPTDTPAHFHGYLTDVQIYDTALSPTQVQQIYEQGFPLHSLFNVSSSS